MTRIRSAGLAEERSPAIQGSMCTTVPECSICTLECKIGVIRMSGPSASMRCGDCAQAHAATSSSVAAREWSWCAMLDPFSLHDSATFR